MPWQIGIQDHKLDPVLVPQGLEQIFQSVGPAMRITVEDHQTPVDLQTISGIGTEVVVVVAQEVFLKDGGGLYAVPLQHADDVFTPTDWWLECECYFILHGVLYCLLQNIFIEEERVHLTEFML